MARPPAGLLEPLQVLSDEVEVDEPTVRVAELPCDRPWNGGPDADVVHAPHRTDAEARRREKRLVGVVRIVEVEIILHDRDSEPPCQVDHGFAADAGEHVLLAGCAHRSAAYQE